MPFHMCTHGCRSFWVQQSKAKSQLRHGSRCSTEFGLTCMVSTARCTPATCPARYQCTRRIQDPSRTRCRISVAGIPLRLQWHGVKTNRTRFGKLGITGWLPRYVGRFLAHEHRHCSASKTALRSLLTQQGKRTEGEDEREAQARRLQAWSTHLEDCSRATPLEAHSRIAAQCCASTDTGRRPRTCAGAMSPCKPICEDSRAG